MGLKINGSLLGLQSVTLSGGSLAVSQRAMSRPTHDSTKRRLAFPAFSSIPHGYSRTGIALASIAGGMAGNFRGDAVEVGGLSATANMASDVTGTVTLSGLAAAGRGMVCAISGSSVVTGSASALANMSVNVQVNAAPKPIDIAGEIMGTLLPNGQTVSQALNLNLGIKNTTSAILGVSV